MHGQYAAVIGFATLATVSWALKIPAAHPPRTALWVRTNSSVNVGWDCAKTWDGGDVIGQDGNNTCKLLKIGDDIQACAGEFKNASAVSSAFYAKHGCTVMSNWWERLPDMSSKAHTHAFAPCLKENDTAHTVSKLFVDTGANTGACLLHMLDMNTVEHAIGFEPNPAHLFYLTNTMLASPKIKAKLSLYKFPLGDSIGTHTLFLVKKKGKREMETVIDAPATKDSKPKPVAEVTTRTLDDVFLSSGKPPYIHLLNLADVDYQLLIVMGARKLLNSGAVNAVKLVFSTEELKEQHAHPIEYLNIYLKSGFDMYPANADLKQPLDKVKLSLSRLHELACGKTKILMHMVAVQRRDNKPNKGLDAC